jgi:hypothetical protein
VRAAPAVSGRPLRVVLFGMPDAGKSSLLGALAQAAQTQEHVLNGRLTDRSQRLLELQRRLYEDRPRETLEEVAPYEVSLQPFAPKGATAEPVSAVLVDCDGRVANELLAQKELTGNGKDRTLTRAVLNADTLVLVVDAATDVAALKRDFGQFARFLRALERCRGERTEVGGLPVYLVLTKCDLLARKDDNSLHWMERIEERKRVVGHRFQEFMAQQERGAQVPFGKVELHLWATAVKRPALADTPAKPREPYGVAELFRQCLRSAAVFRERRESAARWLTAAVLGIVFVVVALGLLMAVLLLSQPTQEAVALNDEVRRYLSANDRPAERFRGVEDRLKQLQTFKDHPDFARLPEGQRDRVNAELKELTAYKQFQDRVQEIGATFSNDLNRIEGDPEIQLADIREKLQVLAVPAEYAAAWNRTPAVQKQRTWLKEVDTLNDEKRKVVGEYERLFKESKTALAEARKLFKADQGLQKVLKRIQLLKDDSDRLNKRRTEDAEKYLPNADEVKNALLFRLPSVRGIQRLWDASEEKRSVEYPLEFLK